MSLLTMTCLSTVSYLTLLVCVLIVGCTLVLEITEVRADTVENGFILVCSAQVYPGPVDNIRMSFLQLNDSNNAFEFSHRNFMYEIRTTLRVPVSSCPPSGYMCVLEVGGDQEVGSARVIGDPVICSQSCECVCVCVCSG